MASTTRVPETEITGLYGALLKRMTRRMLGSVPEAAEVMLEYAEAMSQTPPAVTDEMSAALLEELGPAGLLELTARVVTMNLTARANVAPGIRSQELSAACGLPPLATPSARMALPA
jgi:hypothetical protein